METTGKKRISRVPEGKRVLNLHVSQAEGALLDVWAAASGDTITSTVRRLIRDERDRLARRGW